MILGMDELSEGDWFAMGGRERGAQRLGIATSDVVYYSSYRNMRYVCLGHAECPRMGGEHSRC